MATEKDYSISASAVNAVVESAEKIEGAASLLLGSWIRRFPPSNHVAEGALSVIRPDKMAAWRLRLA